MNARCEFKVRNVSTTEYYYGYCYYYHYYCEKHLKESSTWTVDMSDSDNAGRDGCVQSYKPSPLGLNSFPVSVRTLCKL